MSRATAAKRGYGSSSWKKARAKQLAREPNCSLCAERGIDTKGTTVDHIVPHHFDPRLFDDPGNLQTLCAPCHNSVKQSQERTGVRPGCDADGVPLDRSHHWNEGRG